MKLLRELGTLPAKTQRVATSFAASVTSTANPGVLSVGDLPNQPTWYGGTEHDVTKDWEVNLEVLRKLFKISGLSV